VCSSDLGSEICLSFAEGEGEVVVFPRDLGEVDGRVVLVGGEL